MIWLLACTPEPELVDSTVEADADADADADTDTDTDTGVWTYTLGLTADATMTGHVELWILDIADETVPCIAGWPMTGTTPLTTCADCLFAWEVASEPLVHLEGDCAAYVEEGGAFTEFDRVGFAESTTYAGATWENVLMFEQDGSWMPGGHATWDGETLTTGGHR